MSSMATDLATIDIYMGSAWGFHGSPVVTRTNCGCPGCSVIPTTVVPKVQYLALNIWVTDSRGGRVETLLHVRPTSLTSQRAW